MLIPFESIGCAHVRREGLRLYNCDALTRSDSRVRGSGSPTSQALLDGTRMVYLTMMTSRLELAPRWKDCVLPLVTSRTVPQGLLLRLHSLSDTPISGNHRRTMLLLSSRRPCPGGATPKCCKARALDSAHTSEHPSDGISPLP